jgi:aspartyl-tRNA(Asn)/glutamyl-tRNA(Gln) amidotransferase subunit A
VDNRPPPNLVADPGALALLVAAISAGELDPRELVANLLQRISDVEPQIHAWCDLDADAALAEAEERALEAREGKLRGPLHGIPFAVKDVIDVAGRPTRAGSRTRAGIAPATLDAAVVSAAREAGAIVLGKTHTTEFAYFDGPPPTRNPWNTAHTPGGSSAGSAAAVACGTAPFALGTQTAGSVVRPAAYCGIAAFKPSTLALSAFGVVPFAPTFDTPGFFAYRSADIAVLAAALLPPALARGPRRDGPLHVRILDDALLDEASNEVLQSLADIERRLAKAGHRVERFASPVRLRDVLEIHTTIIEYELGRVHSQLGAAPAGDVAPRLREAVVRGGAIADTAYWAAKLRLAESQQQFWAAHAGCDLLIVPAAPDVAPAGMMTGDPRFIIPFTALGGPIFTLPVALASSGLPLGAMLLASPGADLALAEGATTIAAHIELGRR